MLHIFSRCNQEAEVIFLVLWVQAEQGLHLTVDLVHFGHRYAELAADELEEKLGLVEAVE